jgi:ATP-dependent Zn protease
VLPAAVAAAAEGTVTYTHESLQQFEKQLAAKQIASVTINKRLRSLRTTLKDGRHVLARYGRKEEPKLASTLAAKGVPVEVLKPAVAAKEVPKKAHKLRYIAGGILIVVLLVVGTVLYVDRKRKRSRD